ncbi:MAG: ribonuclease HI [Actinobacteria bacterium]|nr:ribonuclease HI [Actinomycetota bacterium]
MTTRAYTDGACSGNPGPGGWAFVVDSGPWASGAEADSTNQRMEVTAAFEAVRRIAGPLEIVSDSTYVVKCFNDEWWRGWIKRGWRNASKKPIANRDLWEPFIDLVNRRGDVTFKWVKGHSGDPMNDAADMLATQAAADQHGRSGMHYDPSIVDGLGSDVARRRPNSAEIAPGSASPLSGASQLSLDATLDSTNDGPVVVVIGHRPAELGGWDLANPVADALRRQLTEILRAKKQVDPNIVLATGLGLGAEMLAAEAALMAAVPYVAVLPFVGVDARWPAPTRSRFAELLGSAKRQVVMGSEPNGKEGFAKRMRARDDWLAREGTEAIVIWDRSDRNLGRLHDRFDRAFDGSVWILEPPTGV